LTHMHTMAINIFDLKFIDNLVRFNKTIQSGIRIASYILLTQKLINGTILVKEMEFGFTRNYGLVKCGLSR
jgi:hypothetical protein